MPAAIASGLSMSTRIAASPLASSIDGCEETTTGAPDAIASTIGIPKPSKSDGKTKAFGTSVQRRQLIVADIPKRSHTLSAKRRASTAAPAIELELGPTGRRRAKASSKVSRFLRGSTVAAVKMYGDRDPPLAVGREPPMDSWIRDDHALVREPERGPDVLRRELRVSEDQVAGPGSVLWFGTWSARVLGLTQSGW